METTPSTLPVAAPAPVTPAANRLHLNFTGAGGEFFRIWAVNTGLTVVTFGLYWAWAKVRTRKYFYGNTWLDGHNFEYTANPVSILKGHLLVAAVAGLFYIFQFTNPIFAVVVAIIGYALFPWLIQQSMRFQAAYTRYRGLAFRFSGTVREAYTVFLWLPMAVPFTLGALLPYMIFRQRQYIVQNLSYGSERASFGGRPGEVYITYLMAVALSLAAALAVAAVAIPLFVVLGGSLATFEEAASMSETLLMGGLFLAYLPIIMISLLVATWVRAVMLNFTLNHTTLAWGGVSFTSRVNPWGLMWVQFSNTVLQVVTLGLATPWAAVRRARYVIGGVALNTQADLGVYTSGREQDPRALGEAASEFLGLDLGL